LDRAPRRARSVRAAAGAQLEPDHELQLSQRRDLHLEPLDGGEHCDRSVSMREAARRAVEKIQGGRDGDGADPSSMRQTTAEIGGKREV
jgi:hypothetical protein